jgi:hypothetical protein
VVERGGHLSRSRIVRYPFVFRQAQVDMDSGALNYGQVIPFGYDASIACSAAGTIFFFGISKNVEIAKTMSLTTGGNSGQWTVTPYCTPATTPPDFAPIYAPESNYSSYWLQKAICWPAPQVNNPKFVACVPYPWSDTAVSPPSPAQPNRYRDILVPRVFNRRTVKTDSRLNWSI